MQFQRTVRSALTVCLTPGDNPKESLPLLRRGLESFRKAVSGTRVLWRLLLTSLALIAYYALFRPHVSIDPDRVLNPGDPLSTLFIAKNDNPILNVNDFHPTCIIIYLETDHYVRMNGGFVLPIPAVSVIEPLEKTTINVPRAIRGLGDQAGNVTTAFIEIDVSYKQALWPFETIQRFPLKGVRDSVNHVYWTHITLEELRTAGAQ
jgi:hypothetical protein